MREDGLVEGDVKDVAGEDLARNQEIRDVEVGQTDHERHLLKVLESWDRLAAAFHLALSLVEQMVRQIDGLARNDHHAVWDLDESATVLADRTGSL